MSVFDAERQQIIARSLDKLRHFIVCKLGPVAAANVYAGGPARASLGLQDHSSCEVLRNGSFMRRPMKDADQNSFKRAEVQGATSNSRSPRFVKSSG
jgi:hypothetical protein